MMVVMVVMAFVVVGRGGFSKFKKCVFSQRTPYCHGRPWDPPLLPHNNSSFPWKSDDLVDCEYSQSSTTYCKICTSLPRVHNATRKVNI